jgi:hypothetical protein
MTVLGRHSVGELRDWLASIDYEMAQIASAYGLFAPVWQAQDPGSHQDWAADWAALQTRYGAARGRAQSLLARARLELGIPDSVLPAEDEWQAVRHALARTPGQVAKGDLQDLYARLEGAQGKPVDVSRVPQPTAPDADLAAFKAADATIRAGESAARQITPSKTTGALLVVGLGFALGLLLTTRSVLR